MNRAMLRILPLLLAAALLVSCGAESAPAATPASAETAAPTETPAPAPTPKPTPEPVAIHLSETAKIGELAQGREIYTYRRQDVSRLYYYYIPSTYQPGERLPLMLTLHGSGSSASIQLAWGDWVNCAERNGFIVVAPESVIIHRDGTLSSEGLPYWETGQNDFNFIRWNAATTDPVAAYRVDDVQYLCDLVDIFVDAGYADPSRVYSCGLSHGGFMSLRLAIEAPEHFAGVAAVSGLVLAEYCSRIPKEQCRVVFIHGTEDQVVPIDGMRYDLDGDGELDYTYAISLDESAAWFLNRYGIDPAEPEAEELPDTVPTDGTRLYRYEYDDAAGTPQVIKYVVEGGGHTWPGGSVYYGSGVVCKDAQASDLIWAELNGAVRERGAQE